ncbi:MAG: AAA family ATPase [Patescibacteria group bacterium]|jgi:ATP-dependent Clp protease ATP-binding subunit ClpC
MEARGVNTELHSVGGIPTQQLIVCDQCLGSGIYRGKKCRSCFGAGTGITLGGIKAYVPRDLSTRLLEDDRVYLLAQSAVRFTFFIIAVIFLVYTAVRVVVGLVEQSYGEVYSIVNATAGSSLFWFGALAALYVYSSMERDLAGAAKVPHKTYEQKNIFSFFHRQPRAINIYSVLSADAKLQLLRATRLARRRKEHFYSEHLFLALTVVGSVREMFSRLGVDVISVRETVGRVLREQAHAKTTTYDELVKILLFSYREAYIDRGTNIDIPCLFLVTAIESELVREVLYDYGIDDQKLRNVVLWQQNERLLRSRYRYVRSRSRMRPKGKLDRAMTALATPMLDHFSEDLTALAQRGYFLPAVRRQDEIDAALRIFEGGGAPILVGEAGVGKRSILEDIADRMVTGEVPAVLQDKRLVSLLLPRVVSGVTPAEAAERVQRLLYEAARARNIVLAINDVHGVRGITSGGEGSVDLAEVLAANLRTRRVPYLATSKPDEYRKYLEGTSLAGVFETVLVQEPTIDDTIKIVQSRLTITEFKQHVYFSYDAIQRLVNLVSKFMPERRLPKKAIELLDELALFVRQKKGEYSVILAGDVEMFLSSKLNMPIKRVDNKESSLLLSFEDRVHERLVDQEEAVSAVANALRRARAEVRDVKRPVVNLLFLGPTGVGKTELAKTVAALYFGDEGKMVRLDMSEFQDAGSVTKLIGGERSGEPGILTQAVRNNPFSLVLLDEVEKASPGVLNIFLQVMDDGRLTSGAGETIDFTNVILIATSNAGAAYIQDAVRNSVAFSVIEKNLRQQELGKFFQPEFINRFDGVIMFKPLTLEHVLQITRLLLVKIAKRLSSQGIYFEPSEEAVVELAQKGYDPEFGARPLRRVLQDTVDSEIARYLLDGRVKRRDTIVLEAGGVIRVKKAKSL